MLVYKLVVLKLFLKFFQVTLIEALWSSDIKLILNAADKCGLQGEGHDASDYTNNIGAYKFTTDIVKKSAAILLWQWWEKSLTTFNL